jgi:hypothetical protein
MKNKQLPSSNYEPSHKHSLWTLAAVGFLAYYVTVMLHELVGHGSMMYLIGARHFILTSTSIDTSDLHFDPNKVTLGSRLVSIAGALSNIMFGMLLYPLFRFLTRRNASLGLRLFLWLLIAVGIFIGFVYPVYSGIFGVADWSDAIAFMPHHALLRVLEVVIGTLCCIGTVRFFAVSFAEFPEDLLRLALIPYVSAALVFCTAGLRLSDGGQLMIVSVIPAALIGQSILLFVTPIARRLRVRPPTQKVIPTSPTAILIALVFVVIILITAPGVRFTIP